MHEAIQLPFRVVSGVDPSVGVLDGGLHPQGERGLGGFFSGPLVLMAFVSSFVKINVFDSCVKSF